ncbi:MAG TPA: GNAT family N-acetyltransferase [Myxococcota bacterium]|nr:GNAT family N-acetyltransferase [Myxococcota bacterium]
MSSPPTLSIALSRQLSAAHEALHVEGMRAAEALAGNPFEIEVRRFGRATASIARKVPLVEWYNRVVGLEQQDARQLRDMLAFYRTHGVRARFEIGPAELTSALAVALAAERIGLERFETTLYAPIEARISPPPSTLEVRASPLDELDRYFEIWARGFGLPDFLWEDERRIRRAWFAVPGFRRYVALDAGEPVACAGLYLHGDVAYLCMSATLPESRGRGAQSALIARRWREAAEHGSRFVVTQTAYGGTSQNNMERAGMRLAHNFGIWLDYGLPF